MTRKEQEELEENKSKLMANIEEREEILRKKELELQEREDKENNRQREFGRIIDERHQLVILYRHFIIHLGFGNNDDLGLSD